MPDDDLNDVFEAVVDATEEAVLNALWAAPEVVGREGRIGQALPHDDVLELLVVVPADPTGPGGVSVYSGKDGSLLAAIDGS